MFQNKHQTVYTFCNRHVLSNLFHYACVKSFQQSHTSCKALLEVNLSTHGTLRYGFYLVSHSCTFCKFVDAFCLYECGIHIEADESAHTTVHVVTLEREVNLHLRRDVHQFFLHGLAVFRCATERELYACLAVACRVFDAHSARKTQNGVDVQSLFRYYFRCCFDLFCRQGASYDGQDISVLALSAHPVFVFLVGYRCEADVHSKFCCFEQQFFHHLSRCFIVDSYQYAKRQGGMDVGLTDVQNLGIFVCKNFHYRSSKTWTVLSCNAYKDLFLFLFVCFHIIFYDSIVS